MHNKRRSGLNYNFLEGETRHLGRRYATLKRSPTVVSSVGLVVRDAACRRTDIWC
jgi:hypothetical protein